VGELVEQRDTSNGPLQRFVRMTLLNFKHSKLSEGQDLAGSIPEFVLDSQGFAVPVLGLVQSPALLGRHSKLVISGCHARPVA